MKKLFYFFLIFFHCYLFSQQCLSNAGPDRIVCGGTGSNFLVELDGTNSTVPGTSPIRYEWTSLDEGITFSNSQKRRPKPSFQYPQDLLVDTDFRIQLKIYSADGECEDLDTTVITCKANMCPVLTVEQDILASSGCDLSITLDASGTFDPDNSIINFQWSSLDGLDENLINTNSSLSL